MSHRFRALSIGLLLVGCGAQQARRPLLDEYRLIQPRRQVVHPVWLASFTSDELGGRLGPKGRALVYAGNQKGNLDIWIKDLTSGVRRRVTSHVAVDTQPSWSPDGERVVFVSLREDVKGDIYIFADDRLTRLTDSRSEDAYPVFSADGRAIYFASGPEGLSRIVRLELESRGREPVTPWGTTHPAVSPDGLYLAFTRFDADQRGRVAVTRLDRPHKITLITPPDYHAGFPSFSPDGKHLVFSRFVDGPSEKPISTDSRASLWEVDLHRALAAKRPDEALLHPLTSGRTTALFAQHAGRRGIVYTTSRAGSLDIGLIPPGGAIPRLPTAVEQMALALAQDDPRDQLLCLRRVVAMGPGPEASAALYRSTKLLRELGAFSRARRILERLSSESALRHGNVAYISQIDKIVLPVEAQQKQGKRVQRDLVVRTLKELSVLQLPTDRDSAVAAHLLLRRGDLHRMAGNPEAAMAAYETLVKTFPGQRELAAEASFRLGTLLARVQEPALVSAAFLALFSRYPTQTRWLERASSAVLELYADLEPAAQIEALRALMDANAHKVLFWAAAQARVAELFEKLGRLDLAIDAMALVSNVKTGPGLVRRRTEAAFSLGRLCLAFYEELRQRGRLSEAITYYDKALSAYARVIKTFEPGHEHRVRARAEYLRLALLMAGQLERQGERALAEKHYRKILEVAPRTLAAHRKLIQLGVTGGAGPRSDRLAALHRKYERKRDADPGNMVGHYLLGYLETLTSPTTDASLTRAEKHLKRAISLDPRSPFGHMTLGWVLEMRERLLRQERRGWLEEAILHHDRAYQLNDAKIDEQTEADLLLNLCNAFANLGNGWAQAYTFCERRETMKIPFASAARETLYHLTFGRAATATGKYDKADHQLDRAQALSGKLKQPQLEAEIIARRALNAQLQGDRDRSSRLFEEAIARLSALGQTRSLAGLKRSIAYNYALDGRHDAAAEALVASRALLAEHGTYPIETFKPVGGAWRTSAPLGFDPLDEAFLSLSLRGRRYRDLMAWPELQPLLERRLKNRRRAFAARKDDELSREIILLQNDLARTKLARGDRSGFHRSLEVALEEISDMQTEKGRFTASVDLFGVQVALALNRSEQVLADLAMGRRPGADLRRLLDQLRQLERSRADHAAEAKVPLLGMRLQLSLWSNIALLTFHSAWSSSGRTTETKAEKGNKAAPLPRAVAPSGPFSSVLDLSRPFVEAISLLRRIYKETAPARIGAPSREELAEALDRARSKGVLEPLWRPLSPAEELRWHALVGVNLALISAALTPRERLEQHPSTGLLQKITVLGVQHNLGALRYVAAAELAARRQDMGAMRAAVRGFLDRSPLLLPAAYLNQAPRIRGQIFGRAVDLAVSQGDFTAALAFAEQLERRAFLDDLIAISPAGQERAAGPLKRLLGHAAAYRAQLTMQDPRQSAEKIAVWQRQLNHTEHRVQAVLKELRAVRPRVAALFEVSDFPIKDLRQALGVDQVAVGAIASRGKTYLIALGPEGAPRVETMDRSMDRLRALAADTPKRLRRLLAGPLARLIKGASRAYLDLGRIHPILAEGSHLAALLPENSHGVALATLWELSDAHQVQSLSREGALVVDPRPRVAKELGEALGAPVLTGKKLRMDGLGPALERAGLVVWSGPLRFDGRRSTSARLLLHDRSGERLGDLHLARSLGIPLRGHLLVIRAPTLTSGRERPQQVALLRLLHAMGAPSVLMVNGTNQELARVVTAVRGQIKKMDLAATISVAGKSSSPPRLALFGLGGLSPAQAKILAARMIKKSAVAGVGAFRARRFDKAVEHLEGTLRYMAFAEDATFLDGTLEFLGQAYTLLKDYARAVPMMERLIALRAEAIDKARASKKGVLKAQAKWVKAVKDVAWLRMRNEQYDKALAANEQAIKLYIQVKRPMLARECYEQRSTIAEKKGDAVQALDYASRALKTAEQDLAARSNNTSTRISVARAAARVARLQRMKFADYHAAMAAGKKALAHIPSVKPEELSTISKQVDELRKLLAALPKKDRSYKGLKNQALALIKRRKLMASTLGQRVAALLEIARTQGARGAYGRAVARAAEALELARQAGLPKQGAPLLELVNNMYYAGAYGRALEKAEEGLKQAQSPLRKIQFYNAEGSIHAAMGRTEEAERALRAALRIATRLGNLSEMATSRNNLGNALRLAGRFDAARRQFEKALALDQRQEDKLGMAFDHANLGLTEELLEGRRASARTHLEQALRLSREIGAPLNELKALAGLGRLALKSRQLKPAMDHLSRGLVRSEKLGLRDWSWRFHLLMSRARHAEGRPQDLAWAEIHLKKGLAITEQRPPRIRRALSAPRVEERPEELYDDLIDLLAEQGRAEEAFDLSERMRSRSLVDLVAASSAHLTDQAARAQIQRVQQLQVELEAALAARARSARNSRGHVVAEGEVKTTRGALSAARKALAAINPRLEVLVTPEAWPLNRLRSELKKLPNHLILSYAVTRSRLVIWSIKKGVLKMRVVKIGRQRLTAEVRRLRQAITRYSRVEQSANRLFRWLIAAAPHDRGPEGSAPLRLVVVPAGPLHVVPFAALFDGKDFLVGRATISYLPSVNSLRYLAQEKPNPKTPRLSFGWAGTGQRPLTYTGREATAFGRTFPRATVVQGAEATRARFKKTAPTAGLLHIATHATFDEQAPLRSSLELADGELPLLEVLGLALKAELVILSACDTGLGLLAGAEGVIGLGQAFLAAGARRVVASLWRVSDLGAALLMKHLFRHLSDKDPAAALRAAQNRVRKRLAHPAFWAGFRLDGAL